MGSSNNSADIRASRGLNVAKAGWVFIRGSEIGEKTMGTAHVSGIEWHRLVILMGAVGVGGEAVCQMHPPLTGPYIIRGVERASPTTHII